MAIFMFDGARQMNARRFAIVVPRFPLLLPTPPGEDYLMGPAQMMAEEGCEAEVLTTRFPHQSENEKIGPVMVRRFDSTASLMRALGPSRFDLVHAHSDSRPALLTGLISMRSKTVLTRHSYVLPSSSWKRRLLVMLMNRFDRVIALTPYERDIYSAAGVTESKIAVVPNPINVPFFASGGDPTRFRAQWKLDSDAKVMLFVANLRLVKNPEVLLRAFAAVRKEEPTARLVIAGKDLLPTQGSPSASELARRFGVDIATVFTDWLAPEPLRDAFSAAEVVVNTSANEGLPLAICEAAAARKPFCLSRIGSLESTFGPNALYHEPTDDAALAENILKYLRESGLREMHARANRVTVERFDIPVALGRLMSLYRSVLGE